MEEVCFETRENQNNRRFRRRTVKVRLLQDIENPVLDFIRIVTELGDRYNYWDDTLFLSVEKTPPEKSFMSTDSKENLYS